MSSAILKGHWLMRPVALRLHVEEGTLPGGRAPLAAKLTVQVNAGERRNHDRPRAGTC